MSCSSNAGNDSKTSEIKHLGTSPNRVAARVNQEESKILDVVQAQRDNAFDSRCMSAQPLPSEIKNSLINCGFRREQEEKFKKIYEAHNEHGPLGGKRVMREGFN